MANDVSGKRLTATLNHVQLHISDRTRSFPFYRDLLGYLGFDVVREDERSLGMRSGGADIWLRETSEDRKGKEYNRKNTGLNHIAFCVDSKEDVDRFHEEFLIPRSIRPLYGPPRSYPEYTPTYYAVCFEDPDRIKVEVMSL